MDLIPRYSTIMFKKKRKKKNKGKQRMKKMIFQFTSWDVVANSDQKGASP
jgi:hypothetical protein